MIKNLTPFGNSVGIILDKTLLGLLGLERDDAVDIQVEGDALTIRRASKEALKARAARFEAGVKHLNAKHGETLKKLAK